MSITQQQLNGFARTLARKFREFVGTRIAEISQRMDSLERRVRDIPMPERGEPGEPGKDAPPVDESAIVERVLARIPTPKDGRDGERGKDAEVNRDTLTLMIREEVQRAVSGIPTPKDGAAGRDADLALVREIAAIEAAKAVAGISKPEPSLRITDELADELRRQWSAEIARLVAAIEVPRGEAGPKGDTGRDGAPGPKGDKGDSVTGERGPVGPQGERGADGRTPTREEIVEIADESVSRRFAEWALGWERGANETLQRAVERLRQPEDGKDGAPGRDGFGFDDMRAEHNGDGDVVLIFTRGTEEKRFDIRLPRFKYQGVFQEGRAYREGDAVTNGGSLFIARKDSPSGKPAAEGDWTLAVKQGAQGRAGTDGKNGLDGKQGPPGRDLRYT